MSTRHRVGEVRDFDGGARKSIEIDGREITIVRVGDRFAAAWNRCPHANGRLMDGVIAETEIICPLHRWKFDLFTGKTARDRALAATIYPVVVEADQVFVVIGGDPPAAPGAD